MLKYTKNVNNIIGENEMRVEIILKEKRKEKKFTLAQLSAKTGISTTHINDIEEELRKKLLDSIKINGLNNEKTYEISVELDKAINEYYKKIQKN